MFLELRPGARRAASTLLFALHRVGFTEPSASPGRWCALTAPFHPCLCLVAGPSAVCFLLHFPSRRRAQELPGPLPCGVRTFLDVRRCRLTPQPSGPLLEHRSPSSVCNAPARSFDDRSEGERTKGTTMTVMTSISDQLVDLLPRLGNSSRIVDDAVRLRQHPHPRFGTNVAKQAEELTGIALDLAASGRRPRASARSRWPRHCAQGLAPCTRWASTGSGSGRIGTATSAARSITSRTPSDS